MTGAARRGDPGPDLTDPNSFAHWCSEKVRFQDINRFDHVSNVAIAAYAESGRVEFIDRLPPASPGASGAPFWVVAQLELRFLAEIRFPGGVRIGTCVLRVGNSSATLGQGMFAGEDCVATAEAVIVLVDAGTRRARELDEPVRAALAGHMP